MQIHLVIVQPDHYVHSLGFLDTADYLQYWLERQGLQVTVAKNRLRHDAVNLIFGAHLGFHPQWLDVPYCTFFFNLEQIGQGGATVSPAYQALLKSGPVIDYHPANVAAYRTKSESVPLVPFLNAPYLNSEETTLELTSRPIDLLFFGSMNAERKAFIKRIEKIGLDVAVFDTPTYYQERDAYVRQAKAVINTSFYESARFEQVRAFNVLSQGTAFISYLQSGQKIDEDFRDHVFWLDDQNFDVFFKEQFGNKQWCLEAKQKYKCWLGTNPQRAIFDLVQVLQERWNKYSTNQNAIHHPRCVVQSDDGRYFHDALNLSKHEQDEADLTLDLCREFSLPWVGVSRWGQHLELATLQLEKIVMRLVPENSEQWQALCHNAMKTLADGGHLIFELPLEQLDASAEEAPQFKSGHAVIDTFTNRFWRSGAFRHRLDYVQSVYLDGQGKTCLRHQAKGGRLVFVKRATTAQECTLARMELPSFGRTKSEAVR